MFTIRRFTRFGSGSRTWALLFILAPAMTTVDLPALAEGESVDPTATGSQNTGIILYQPIPEWDREFTDRISSPDDPKTQTPPNAPRKKPGPPRSGLSSPTDDSSPAGPSPSDQTDQPTGRTPSDKPAADKPVSSGSSQDQATGRGSKLIDNAAKTADKLMSDLRRDPGADLSPGPVVDDIPGRVPAPPQQAQTKVPLPSAGSGSSAPGPLPSRGALGRAGSRFTIGDYEGADTLLTQHLQEHPDDTQALRYRAMTRRLLRRFGPSADDARRALPAFPRDPLLRRTLIEDLVDLGRPQEAIAVADEALKAGPRDGPTLAGRSRAWEALGRRDLALADLKEAAALDSQFEEAYKKALAADGPAPASRSRRSIALWYLAAATSLLLFSYALFRRRSESSIRRAQGLAPDSAPAREQKPDRLPEGFEVLRVLGQGGMGVVYEAMDLALQRPVAIKKMRPEVAESPRERARFLKEARTVAGLKHPNIVEIHSIHEDDGGLFLVFEKVPGETLHERLGRGALRPAEAVAILKQVALALDYAHSQGVIHQDLKPGNIMLAGDRAKVMDFGIARRVAQTMSTLSRLEVAGTPAYMAPEQAQGSGVGPTADVFALGVCAYELLSGQTPFPTGNMMMKIQKAFPPLSKAAPGLPERADAVIARALEPEPKSRWPSASSFVEAFARSLG